MRLEAIYERLTVKSVSHFYAGCSCADVWYNDTVTPLKWIENRYECGDVTSFTHQEKGTPPVTNNRGERAVYNGSGTFSDFIRDYEDKRYTFGMLVQKYKTQTSQNTLRLYLSHRDAS